MRSFFLIFLVLTLVEVSFSYNGGVSHRRAFLKSARSLTRVSAGITAITAAQILLTADGVNAEQLEYLAEPTEEFKASEAERAKFRAQQSKIKKEFDTVLASFAESKKEADIIKDLNSLQNLAISTGGLPVGLKFDDIKKTVRRKKADFGKSWTTQEEIAYQALCREISFQQNPNKDKDMGNPL
ncbi:hypothetical protein TrCOL_g7459 [Triparma columacea]|uniref:RxLR effector protein n=1 Tax=Triparma columacea TaxID=722753 RepID=A0A9W7G3T9_9STRA|nr:hypothetical protein TrCOL_g7459 [Triparma columacea]